MTDEQDGEWLATPAGADDVVLDISIGENVELTPAVRQALETLMAEFADDEVTGHGSACPAEAVMGCTEYDCNLGRCRPETNRPCLADWRCRITKPKSVF